MTAALVLGGAKCVFEDYAKARSLGEFSVVIGANDIIAEISEINHAVSMHPGKLPRWLKKRKENGHPDVEGLWTAFDRSPQVPQGLKVEFLRNTRGGSGLLAVYVARKLGCDRIVLAGVPMTLQGEHFHTPGWWKEYHLYKVVWDANASLKTDVRSMSGWTMEKFGEPTPSWVAGQTQ